MNRAKGTTCARSPGAAAAAGFGQAAPGRAHPAVFLAGRVGHVRSPLRFDDAGASRARVSDDRRQFGNLGSCVTGDPRVFGRVFVATNGRGIL